MTTFRRELLSSTKCDVQAQPGDAESLGWRFSTVRVSLRFAKDKMSKGVLTRRAGRLFLALVSSLADKKRQVLSAIPAGKILSAAWDNSQYRRIGPFLNCSMTIGKRPAAAIIVISCRRILPGRSTRRCIDKPAIINASRVFINEHKNIGRESDAG